MARVIWSRTALHELREITDYLLAHDEAAARRISQSLMTLGNGLSDFPNRGRPAGRYRELVNVPPYILRYTIVDTTVRIPRIRHSSRRRLIG